MKSKKMFLMMAAGLFALGSVACDNKETVIEADTPAGGMKVERDKDTGAIDVEIDGNSE